MIIDVPLAKDGRLRSGRCLVMGILNATPDSFSDGGELADPSDLDARIQAMLAEGADILDVGGESTRPGHEPVPADEELRRVLPVIEAIRRHDPHVPISIDTRKAVVAEAALAAGASFINDVGGMDDPAMAEVVRDHRCAIVLMRHGDLQGEVVDACARELMARWQEAVAGGVPLESIILDPGLGFGTRPGGEPADNVALIERQAAYSQGFPVLIGASRKRFVGTLTGESDPRRRTAGSVALAVLAARNGAAIVRVHDVGPTVKALQEAGL